MITSFNIVTSLRVYLSRKYGVPTIIKEHGWKHPEVKPFLTVKDFNNLYRNYGKEMELVESLVPIEIGIHADSMRGLHELHANMLTEIMYGVIPLLDSSGTQVGEFSFTGLEEDSEIISDVEPIQYETAKNRRYLVATTRIIYTKQYK